MVVIAQRNSLITSLPHDTTQDLEEGKKKKKRQHTYFAEVPNDVVPLSVVLRQDVEEERLDVKIQSFVVKEQLRQQTEVLTIGRLLPAVDFPDRQLVLPVMKKGKS